MEQAFWLERWQRNEIGFHRSSFNPGLTTFWPRLRIPAGSTVLVPLCGKSLDLIWLHRQGYRVVGVETSSLAVEAFFRENGLSARVARRGDFDCYSIDDLTILCGDFFDLGPELVPEIGAFYDRAALIAMPENLRRRYARHLAATVPANVRGLLITLEYPRDEMAGPPFSVDDTQLSHLLAGDFRITELHRQDLLSEASEEASRWRAKGLTRLEEKVFALNRESSPVPPAIGEAASP